MYILKRRFFFSWILSSLLMFGLSYLWHGVITTDLQKINYPIGIFLGSAGIVYFVLGFLLTKIYQSRTLSKRYGKQPFNKGLIAGAGFGFVLFLVVLVLGVSFGQSRTLEFMLIDLGWQVSEQMFGGLVVSCIHVFVWDPAPLPEEIDN